MVMHESRYSLLAFDLFIQTSNFSRNLECVESIVTSIKEQIFFHSPINIQCLLIYQRNGFCVFLLSVLKKEVNSEYNTLLLLLGKENEKKSGWPKGKFNTESEIQKYFRGNSIVSETSCMLHLFTQ